MSVCHTQKSFEHKQSLALKNWTEWKQVFFFYIFITKWQMASNLIRI